MGKDADRTRAVENNTLAQASASAVDADEFLPGTAIGAYVVQRMLASGGGGTVYFARHRLLGREAAVKVLRRSMADSPQMVQRFFREALAVNVIKHPNIVDIFEFGELPDRRPFYVMEYLEGTDLKSMLRERGRFTPAEAVALLEPVCNALEAAHAAGIIHRDLKSSNIHVGLGGEPDKPQIKLLDFGVAKMLEPMPNQAGLTTAGSRLGTSQTMAPEQIEGGQVGRTTDVYALGVLLYQMLTGRYPFHAEDPTEVEMMHLQTPPPRPSQSAPVSPALDAVVLKAMEKTPDRRFSSVLGFIRALREAVDGETETSRGRSAEAVKAVAIYVEVRSPSGDNEELDEAQLEESLMSIDEAEHSLRGADYTLPLQTGTALLAVRVLSPANDKSERARAVELAKQLATELAHNHPSIQVVVSVHAGQAQIRHNEGGLELVGGPIASIAQWVPQNVTSSVFVTAEAADGLAD